MIKKSKWEKTKIHENDRIEIVIPFAGGWISVDKLKINEMVFNSRLIMGTSLYPNIDILNKSLIKSETEIITVAIRRLNIQGENDFLKQIQKNTLIFQILLDVLPKKKLF